MVANVPGLPGRRYVSRLEASAHVDGRAYLTFDGHWDNDLEPYVFVTEDFGASWRRIAQGLPDHSINVVRESPRAANLLFLGNEVGVFASVDRGANWVRMTGDGDFPTVPVDDLVIHPRDNDLVVGTHGRSIWIVEDISPLERLSAAAVAEGATLFPVRRATFWSRTGGWPFWGETWFARNPPIGARIRVHLASEADSGSVHLLIADAAGDTVRRLKGPTSAGMHEVIWDLTADPAGDEATGGAPVIPGQYTVTLVANGTRTSQGFEVRLDPRITAPRAALETRTRLFEDALAVAEAVRPAQEAIRTANEALADMEERVSEHDAPPEGLAERIDSLQARLEGLREDIQDVAGDVRSATGGVQAYWGEPTADQRFLVELAWERIPGLVRELNTVLTTELPALQQELERLGIRRPTGGPVPVPTRPGG